MPKKHRESIVADIVQRCCEELGLSTYVGKFVFVGDYSIAFKCLNDVVLVSVYGGTDDDVEGHEVTMSYDVAYSRISSLIKLVKSKDEADKLSDITFVCTLQYIGRQA